jgi:hypothetical protein
VAKLARQRAHHWLAGCCLTHTDTPHCCMLYVGTTVLAAHVVGRVLYREPTLLRTIIGGPTVHFTVADPESQPKARTLYTLLSRWSLPRCTSSTKTQWISRI